MNAGGRRRARRALLFLHADTRLPDDYPALVAGALAPRASWAALRPRLDAPGSRTA
jgi:hypothetical protein